IIAALAQRATQPAALRAEDERGARSAIERRERRRRALGEPAAPVPALLQPPERAREVDGADAPHAVEPPPGRLGADPAARRRARWAPRQPGFATLADGPNRACGAAVAPRLRALRRAFRGASAGVLGGWIWGAQNRPQRVDNPGGSSYDPRSAAPRVARDRR